MTTESIGVFLVVAVVISIIVWRINVSKKKGSGKRGGGSGGIRGKKIK